MTAQEAIDKINSLPAMRLEVTGELQAALHRAVYALKKQISVKPYFGTEKALRCGVCGTIVKGRGYNGKICDKYCDRCGQSIDWSDCE